MLESLDHGDNSFVTLTYDPNVYDGDLCPEHLRDWLKRLRKRISPKRVRYYSVGEYGDHTGRAHYHSALFGFPPCYGTSRIIGDCNCPSCSVVRQTWGFGHVLVGRLEMKSAAYLSGYVTKKMTMRDDPRLMGRHPEFARMSLRPGIGASAMWNVASVVLQHSLEERGDVPQALKFGGKEFPLGRYLRNQLRKMVGKNEGCPRETLQELANQVSLVRRFAFDNSRSVQSVFEEINAPYAATLGVVEKMRGRSL